MNEYALSIETLKLLMMIWITKVNDCFQFLLTTQIMEDL